MNLKELVEQYLQITGKKYICFYDGYADHTIYTLKTDEELEQYVNELKQEGLMKEYGGYNLSYPDLSRKVIHYIEDYRCISIDGWELISLNELKKVGLEIEFLKDDNRIYILEWEGFMGERKRYFYGEVITD